MFTVKNKPDGSIKRLEAQLAAKGFAQTHRLDFHETFAPVARLNSIRVLLSLAANKNRLLLQLGVKNAFLHRDLHEEAYMAIPLGAT